MKKVITGGVIVIVVLIAIVGILRIVSGEDTWICQDGQWIQHGHPSSAMPTEPCGEQLVGGERDEHGCLGPAGYSWDEEISACIRPWEITNADEKKAAQIATQIVPVKFGLTVVKVTKEEGEGAYTVDLSKYNRVTEDFESTSVQFKNWDLPFGFEGVEDFEGCAEMGYPIMESYPRQCAVPGGETFTEYIGNVMEKQDVIRLDTPQPNSLVRSPLPISGSARGWYFEGSFPIRLLDQLGNEVVSHYATAQSDWMTNDWVDFEATLEFEKPEGIRGTLILQKDNPSGLPENDDALRIPVRFE
jgi:hypothetical protein